MSLARKRVGLGGLLALLLALSFLALACGDKPQPAPPPTPTPAPAPIVLPQDDAPHPGFSTEWWYYNGHLEAATGERYSFHYVLFHVELPGLRPLSVYQLGITDHQGRRYATDQRRAEVPEKGAGGQGFSYQEGGWTIAGLNGNDRLVGSAEEYEIDLRLEQVNPPALHGGAGWLDFGPGAETYYYSRTRMKVSGSLKAGGRASDVSGEAWFDHQWGDFQPLQVSWDWFALQLADGSDVMVFQVRDPQGKPFASFGSFVAKGGPTTPLGATEFQLSAIGTWKSPKSGAVYPMGWTLRIPNRGIDVALAPVIEEAEFDATSTTFNYYWEGPVSVRGSHSGRGFVEMVGYARPRLPASSQS